MIYWDCLYQLYGKCAGEAAGTVFYHLTAINDPFDGSEASLLEYEADLPAL